jgi:hypothetical protein
MRPPKNLLDCGLVFLPDGYVVIAYPEAEVRPMENGELLVTLPVTYYSEEWEWLDGGFIHLGAEHADVAHAEAKAWHGRTSLTGSPQ